MRLYKYSRLKIYVVTTLLAFVITAFIGIAVVLNNQDKYFDVIIAYIKKETGVNISVSSIKLKLPFIVDIDNLRISSKESDNPFAAISEASFHINPFRIFIKRDILYLISDIKIDDAFLYPHYIDNSTIKPNNNESTSMTITDVKEQVDSFLKALIDKELIINNFRISLSDSGSEVSKPIEAVFTTFKLKADPEQYLINSTISLPDDTLLTLNINSETDLNNLYLNFIGYDANGSLFNYEANTMVNEDEFILTVENSAKKEKIGDIKYNIKNESLNFNIAKLNINKATFNKIYSILDSSTMLENFIKIGNDTSLDNSNNFFDNFLETSLTLDGRYKKNEPLYLNFSVNTQDENFDININGMLTNEIVYLNNAVIKTKMGEIFAKGQTPIKEPFASEFYIKTDGLVILNETLNLDMNIKPVYISENSVYSRLTISKLKYKESLEEKLVYGIDYRKKSKKVDINLITTNTQETLKASINMNTQSEDIFSVSGIIPQNIFIALVGYGVVDPLSRIEIDYTLSRGNHDQIGNTHYLTLATKKIYTENNIFYLNTSLNQNTINITDISYNGITGSAKIEYDNDFNFNLSGDINTIFGKYFVSGGMVTENNNRLFYASTDDKSIVAQGEIKSNGKYRFTMSTTEDILLNGINISAKVEIDNTTKTNSDYYLHGAITAQKIGFPVFAINTGFELTNDVIAFTNIIYDYGINTLTGTGELKLENDNLNLNIMLNERYTDGILAIDAELNPNNIYATIVGNNIPVYLNMNGGIYGNVSTKATIIGSTKDPVMYLDEFKVKNFEVLGYLADISLTGYYRKEEIEIKDIIVDFTGKNGIFYPATSRPSIKIPRAYISKDVHSVELKIKDLYYLSTYSANINYNMRVLGNGDTEYRLKTGTISVNKRRLQGFNTIIIDNGENISFRNQASHGINGFIGRFPNILSSDLTYVYDNETLLDVEGTIAHGESNDVDMLVTSQTINVEIFEIFNNIFTSIKSDKVNPTTFKVDGKEYRLHAKLGGTTDNITIDGRLVGNISELKTPFFSDVFKRGGLDFSFKGNSGHVNKLEFFTRNGKSLSLTGDAELTHNFVNYMNFDLVTSPESLGFLDANADIGVLKAKGPVYIELNIGGDISQPIMTGKATLNRTDIQITVEPENRFIPKTYSKASQVYWNFDVEARQRVRVTHILVGDVYIADGDKIRIYNSIAEGIEVEGSVNIERGNIYYLQNIYTVERGMVIFPTENSTDPIIDATAYTHTKYYSYNTLSSLDADTAGYDVTLYMEINSRVSSLLFDVTGGFAPIKFYTIPALGQYQVNQLAGVIQNTSLENIDSQIYAATTSSTTAAIEADKNKIQQIAMSYGDLILKNTVLRPVERWVRQFFGIDYINLNPAVIGNLIDIENNNNITTASVFDNTSVGIGKYVSKNLYIKYDITYRFNDPLRPSSSNRPDDAYFFDHQLGFEVSLLNHLRLANVVFEYTINPLELERVRQEFNLITRWRF